MSDSRVGRLSFEGAAAFYDEIRPTYPPALFCDLFDRLPAEPRVVEVGPGTGQATRDLLAGGARVDAVEISPAMARLLRANHPTTDLKVMVGDFELVDLEPVSFDAVFSSTAYHWIAPAAQLNRPAELLKPGGLLAVVDTIQVDSPDDDGSFDAVQPVYQRWGQGHRGPPAPLRTEVEPPMRHRLVADPRFGEVSVTAYDWNQTYSASDYRKLMLSYSVTQMMDPDDRVGLLDEVETFIQTPFGGQIVRPLVVTLTLALKI